MRNFLFALAALSLVGTVGCRTDTGRCEDVCATFDDCDGFDIDVDDCVEACVADAEGADDGCHEAFAAAADCASEHELDCDDFLDECEDEIEDNEDDCEDDFEDTFEEIFGGGGGGTCTDSCTFAFDGYCDEPNICAAGTDATDCGGC
jgi:hypothetical protein